MQKKRLLGALLLLLVIILVIILFAHAEPSEEDIKKETGGVIICDIDFPCGNADNVCPEDFGAECKVEDPDCK